MTLHFFTEDVLVNGVLLSIASVKVRLTRDDVEFAKEQLEAEGSEYYR